MTQSDNGAGSRIAGAIEGALEPCWLCGRPVSARALFCHGCGGVLPPRDLDAFTRLNLERRFDLDLERVDRQRAGLTRALAPERFIGRGVRQQAYARAQSQAITAAGEALRDPVRRAATLLELLGVPRAPYSPADDSEAMDLRGDLAAADDGAAVGRVVLAVERRIEAGLRELAIAFRTGLLGNAARILARLQDLEAVRAAARGWRGNFGP